MQYTVELSPLTKEKVEYLAQVFVTSWLPFDVNKAKWQRYYEEQEANTRLICIANKQGKPVGYGTLLLQSKYTPFKESTIPEINDLWVAPTERKQGFAKLIITYLEGLAKAAGYKQIGLAVGLYADYGSAQRLYYKLGYKPDGRGITYNTVPAIPGTHYQVDDELLLWLTKKLD